MRLRYTLGDTPPSHRYEQWAEPPRSRSNTGHSLSPEVYVPHVGWKTPCVLRGLYRRRDARLERMTQIPMKGVRGMQPEGLGVVKQFRTSLERARCLSLPLSLLVWVSGSSEEWRSVLA